MGRLPNNSRMLTDISVNSLNILQIRTASPPKLAMANTMIQFTIHRRGTNPTIRIHKAGPLTQHSRAIHNGLHQHTYRYKIGKDLVRDNQEPKFQTPRVTDLRTTSRGLQLRLAV